MNLDGKNYGGPVKLKRISSEKKGAKQRKKTRTQNKNRLLIWRQKKKEKTG